MANRNFDHVQALGKGITLLAGTFKLDTGGNAGKVKEQFPTVAHGAPFAVTKKGGGAVGIYTLTLTDAYPYILAVLPSIMTDPGTVDLQVKTVEKDPAGLVELQLVKTSDGSAVDNADNVKVDFLIVAKNSTVVP